MNREIEQARAAFYVAAARRREQMARYYDRGWTLAGIGEQYGVSRQRVRALLLQQGLVLRRCGPRSVRR